MNTLDIHRSLCFVLDFLASLLPPAVNNGLLFAYAILGSSFSHIAAADSLLSNTSNADSRSILSCPKYIDNTYLPLYQCNLATEAAILGSCSFLLTIVNILCMIVTALVVLRIKQVIPSYRLNKNMSNLFDRDVRRVHDHSRTMDKTRHRATHPLTCDVRRDRVSKTIESQWTRQSLTTSDKIKSDLERTMETSGNAANIDMEFDRARSRLSMFVKRYELDLFNEHDRNLIDGKRHEKVSRLVRDLLDLSQDVPNKNVTQTSTNDDDRLFSRQMIDMLPQKWYRMLLLVEQQRQTHHRSFQSIQRTSMTDSSGY
jgi:hypothetical protein